MSTRGGQTQYRRTRPGRNAPSKHVEQGPETLEEIIEALDEMLGEDRHTQMRTLLWKRKHGDQSQPWWVRCRKSDGLVELYLQLEGITGDDLLQLLRDVDEDMAASVLRRIEETFVKRAGEITHETLLSFSARYLHLTEKEAAALQRGRNAQLAQLLERHTQSTRWARPPTGKHLEGLHHSTDEVQEVYWALLKDHLEENPLSALPGGYSSIPYEHLLDVAQHVQE